MRFPAAIILLFLIAAEVFASSGKHTREAYIARYGNLAVQQMRLSGIPASIILAQACLESSDGNSVLAVKGNNHFGIKCHGWKGKTIRMDDDRKDECFRKYDSAEQSFRDHSDFLRYRDRYAFLFELGTTDYRGWAYGLAKAGYATDANYASLLIKIIEENGLQRYDAATGLPSPSAFESASDVKLDDRERSLLYGISVSRKVYSRNGVSYILAESYDSYSSIADEFNLFHREILRFNDLGEDENLSAGELIYISRKKAEAADRLEKHVVEKGETMRSISQRYAVRLSKLYKYNDMKPGSEPYAGDMICLRPGVRTSK